MRNQYDLFLNLAAQVATYHDRVNELKEAYINFRKKYFGDSYDMFQEADQNRKKKSLLTRKGTVLLFLLTS
jgi:hypothetical protein